MAQTVGIFNGTLLKIYIDDVVFTHITEHSHSISVDMIETTNHGSGGDASYIPGKRGATFSLSGFFADDATEGYKNLETDIFARTAATIKSSTGVVGDHYIEYSCYCNSLDRSTSTEGEVTYSASFTATGSETIGVIA